MRDQKLHAFVVQSTFGSKVCKNKPFLEHFWKLRCRKSARCCVAKHMPKSKYAKHTVLVDILEVEVFKTCTPL